MLGLRLPYLLAALATLTLLLPLGAGLPRWARLSRGQRLVLLYLGLELVTEVVCFGLGRAGKNNQWVAYVAVPVMTATLIAAFAEWQVDAVMARILRVAAPMMLLFWLPPLLRWEPATEFSLGIDSVQAVLCLAAAAYTVVRRTLESDTDPLGQAWFPIGIGVMLYFGAYALMNPLNRYFMKVAPDTAVSVLTVRAGLQVLSNLLYCYGMQCPRNRQSSGPSTSPPSRWAPSWSSRSAPP